MGNGTCRKVQARIFLPKEPHPTEGPASLTLPFFQPAAQLGCRCAFFFEEKGPKKSQKRGSQGAAGWERCGCLPPHWGNSLNPVSASSTRRSATPPPPRRLKEIRQWSVGRGSPEVPPKNASKKHFLRTAPGRGGRRVPGSQLYHQHPPLKKNGPKHWQPTTP